jgi:hypothetical protein
MGGKYAVETMIFMAGKNSNWLQTKKTARSNSDGLPTNQINPR